MLAISIIIFVFLSIGILFLQDDAFTSFRYIQNFTQGNGLVFNIGEYVEGYTNFLWVLLLSVPAYFDLNFVDLSQVLSIVFGLFIFPLTFLIAKQLQPFDSNTLLTTLFNTLPLLMLSFVGGFHYWSVSGMETTLFSFLILLAVLLFMKRLSGKSKSHLYVWILILATLTRPEGLIFFVLFIGFYIILKAYDSGSIVKTIKIYRRELLIEISIYFIPIAIYTIFRLLYYGYPFPNTYYAKTSYEWYYIGRGLTYLWESLSQNLLYGIMLILPATLLWYSRKNLIEWFLYSISIIYLLAIVMLGGDVLPFNRFIIPIIPLVFILFCKSVELLISKALRESNSSIRSLAAILASVMILGYSFRGYESELPLINDRRDVEEGLVTKMKIYAEWVNEQIDKTGEPKTAALSTIGAFSYYSNATVIDMIGLTDEYIAHNPEEIEGIAENVSVLWKERRYNAEYVLDRKPDYIIFPAGAKPSAFPESALFSRERFIKNYYLQLIYSDELKQYLPIFTRKESMSDLDGDDFYNFCDLEFVGHYIVASSEFLRFVNDRTESRLQVIITECKKMIEACPEMSSEAYSTIGCAYFHKGDLKASENYLVKAIESDEMNSLPYVYLIELMNKTNRDSEAIYYMKRLKRLSPDALPNIEFSDL